MSYDFEYKLSVVVLVYNIEFTTIIFLPENVYAVQKKITNPAKPLPKFLPKAAP